jgi:hypothetical protein
LTPGIRIPDPELNASVVFFHLDLEDDQRAGTVTNKDSGAEGICLKDLEPKDPDLFTSKEGSRNEDQGPML